MRSVVSESAEGKFLQTVSVAAHRVWGDEPVEDGGGDLGLSPYDFLFAALATCSSMTIKMVADRRGWPLRHVHVEVTGERSPEGFVFRRRVAMEGDLSDDQRADLLKIAERCPVAKTLTHPIRIESSLAQASAAR